MCNRSVIGQDLADLPAAASCQKLIFRLELKSLCDIGWLRKGQQPNSPFLLPSFQSPQEEVQPYLNHYSRFKNISLVGLNADAYSLHLQFFGSSYENSRSQAL